MSSPKNQQQLTIDLCSEYVRQSTFRLQPVDYGRKYPKWPGAVGLEMEFFPVQSSNLGMKPTKMYEDGPADRLAVAPLLERLAQKHNWTKEIHPDLPGEKLFRLVMEKGDNITFEPGGQIEFSSIPYPCLDDAVTRMTMVLDSLREALRDGGIEPVQMGVNPWQSAEEITLQVAKGRYRAMDSYFNEIGPFGRRMMRTSATVQVNLDFGDSETVLAKRYLLGQLLAPFAAATFSYSPFHSGHKAEVRGFRTNIWRHVDPKRTGFPGGLDRVAKQLNLEACVDSYLGYLLDAPVIFVAGHSYTRPEVETTFAQWLEKPLFGLYPNMDDLSTHASLLFPEVRPRGFLELRSIDCQAEAWQVVPAAYYCGLLYDSKSTDQALDLLLPLLNELPHLMVDSVNGLSHPKIGKTAQQVMELALAGFARLPSCFKEDALAKAFPAFAEGFTARGLAPGDVLLQTVQDADGSLALPVLRELEESWKEGIG